MLVALHVISALLVLQAQGASVLQAQGATAKGPPVEVRTSLSRTAGYDLDIRSQQYGSARARENIKAPWYNEWDRFTQQQIQNALLRQVTPKEALMASADQARGLKKEWE